MRDAVMVSHQAVVADPKAVAALHDDARLAVARHQVPPDHGVGGLTGGDSAAGATPSGDVVPEGAVEDPIVMRLEEEHPHLVTNALRPVPGAVSHQTTDAAKEENADESVPHSPDAQDPEVTGDAEVESNGELAHRSM